MVMGKVVKYNVSPERSIGSPYRSSNQLEYTINK